MVVKEFAEQMVNGVVVDFESLITIVVVEKLELFGGEPGSQSRAESVLEPGE